MAACSLQLGSSLASLAKLAPLGSRLDSSKDFLHTDLVRLMQGPSSRRARNIRYSECGMCRAMSRAESGNAPRGNEGAGGIFLERNLKNKTQEAVRGTMTLEKDSHHMNNGTSSSSQGRDGFHLQEGSDKGVGRGASPLGQIRKLGQDFMGEVDRRKATSRAALLAARPEKEKEPDSAPKAREDWRITGQSIRKAAARRSLSNRHVWKADIANVDAKAAPTHEELVKVDQWSGIMLLNFLAALYGTNAVATKFIEVAAVTPPASLACLIKFGAGALAFSPALQSVDARAHPKEKGIVLAGLELASWLMAGIVAQSVGLGGASASGNASLLFAFTVVLVPLLEVVTKRRSISKLTWVASIAALIGMGVLKDADGLNLDDIVPHVKDLLGLASSFFFAAQIFRAEMLCSKYDPLKLTAVQLVFMFLIALGWEGWSLVCQPGGFLEALASLESQIPQLPWGPLLYSGLACGGVAAWIELNGLRNVHASTATLIYTTIPIWGGFMTQMVTGAGGPPNVPEAVASSVFLCGATFFALMTAPEPKSLMRKREEQRRQEKKERQKRRKERWFGGKEGLFRRERELGVAFVRTEGPATVGYSYQGAGKVGVLASVSPRAPSSSSAPSVPAAAAVSVDLATAGGVRAQSESQRAESKREVERYADAVSSCVQQSMVGVPELAREGEGEGVEKEGEEKEEGAAPGPNPDTLPSAFLQTQLKFPFYASQAQEIMAKARGIGEGIKAGVVGVKSGGAGAAASKVARAPPPALPVLGLGLGLAPLRGSRLLALARALQGLEQLPRVLAQLPVVLALLLVLQAATAASAGLAAAGGSLVQGAASSVEASIEAAASGLVPALGTAGNAAMQAANTAAASVPGGTVALNSAVSVASSVAAHTGAAVQAVSQAAVPVAAPAAASAASAASGAVVSVVNTAGAAVQAAAGVAGPAAGAVNAASTAVGVAAQSVVPAGVVQAASATGAVAAGSVVQAAAAVGTATGAAFQVVTAGALTVGAGAGAVVGTSAGAVCRALQSAVTSAAAVVPSAGDVAAQVSFQASSVANVLTPVTNSVRDTAGAGVAALEAARHAAAPPSFETVLSPLDLAGPSLSSAGSHAHAAINPSLHVASHMLPVGGQGDLLNVAYDASPLCATAAYNPFVDPAVFAPESVHAAAAFDPLSLGAASESVPASLSLLPGAAGALPAPPGDLSLPLCQGLPAFEAGENSLGLPDGAHSMLGAPQASLQHGSAVADAMVDLAHQAVVHSQPLAEHVGHAVLAGASHALAVIGISGLLS
eukprot:jgi/Mesen1/7282/ME000373S06351